MSPFESCPKWPPSPCDEHAENSAAAAATRTVATTADENVSTAEPVASTTASTPGPAAVLDFWFPKGRNTGDFQLWYQGGKELDAKIIDQFGNTNVAARKGELNHWRSSADGALALTIVLDQFTRQIYRGTGDAFSADTLSRQTVRESLKKGYDESWSVFELSFGIVMPLMHSEDLEDHKFLAKYLNDRIEASDSKEFKEAMQGNLKFEVDHREMIEKFGRYPYRNKSLGRENTAEEEEYLSSLPPEKRYGQ